MSIARLRLSSIPPNSGAIVQNQAMHARTGGMSTLLTHHLPVPRDGYRSSRRSRIEETGTYQSAENEQQSDDHSISRLRLGMESFLVGIASSALTILIYTALWDRQERLKGSMDQYNWAPLHDLDGMLMLMPVGFFIYSFLPPGWFFWSGFILAQRFRKRSLYGLCALGGSTFDFMWPKHCVGMLGI